MPKIPYTKSPLSYFEQIEQLRSRGLTIENEEKAIHILTQISYYRLSGYVSVPISPTGQKLVN